MKRGTTYVIGLVVMLGFMAFGFGGFRKSMQTYRPFGEARKSEVAVQIKGELLKERTTVDEKTGDLIFYLRDTSKDEMKVRYAGSKPGNFDQASHVVAVGMYKSGEFKADRLLVKCPSKYQGKLKETSEGQGQ